MFFSNLLKIPKTKKPLLGSADTRGESTAIGY